MTELNEHNRAVATTMPRRVPLTDCQPSQLLIDFGRLREMAGWFDPEEPNYEPVPVLRPEQFPLSEDAVGPETAFVLTDGHTRALLASLCGFERLDVRLDSDVGELDLETYARCIEWTIDAGITNPSDLAGQVVSREQFLEEWVARCQSIE